MRLLNDLTTFRWDSIIGSSTATMRKLPLIFHMNWEQKEKEVSGLARKHNRIILDTVKINSSKLFKVLSKVGLHARHLELDEVEVSHSSFKDILRIMKNLETLSISESCMINSEDFEAQEPSPNVHHLKSLIMLKSSWKFFRLFYDLRVSELKIMSKNFEVSDREPFEMFLLHQSELESLAIQVQQGDFYRSFTRFESIGYPFKLKKLCVDYKYWGDDSLVDDCLVAFLKSQNSTLEVLETRRNLSDKISETIFKHLKVKRLMTSCSNMSTSPLFYNAIRPNPHLKSLIVTGELNKLEVVRGMLHMYQGINKLIIKDWVDEVINEVILLIANNLKHLNYLEVPSLTLDVPELPIPNLKTFRVDFVENVQQWQTICINNPSIEHLSVKWLTNRNIFTYEVLNAVSLRLPNLKRITFGAYFNPTVRILTALNRNCPKLEKIEVLADNSSHETVKSNVNADAGRVKVTFFPHAAANSLFKDEETMWDDVEKSCVLESDDSDVDLYGNSDEESNSDLDSNDDDYYIHNPVIFWGGDEDDIEDDQYDLRYGPGMFFFG